jgi:hypothetical protein
MAEATRQLQLVALQVSQGFQGYFSGFNNFALTSSIPDRRRDRM